MQTSCPTRSLPVESGEFILCRLDSAIVELEGEWDEKPEGHFTATDLGSIFWVNRVVVWILQNY